MRRRIYVDGKPAWSENEPARARMPGSGGGLTLGNVLLHLSPVRQTHRYPAERAGSAGRVGRLPLREGRP